MTRSSSSSTSAASYFCQGPDELYDRLGSLVNSEEGLLQQWCGTTAGSSGEEEDSGTHALPSDSTKKKKKKTKNHSLQEAPRHYLDAVQQQYLNAKQCSSLLDDDNNDEDDDDDNELLHETLSVDGSVGSLTKFKIVSTGGGGGGGGGVHPTASTRGTTRRRSSIPNSMIPTTTDFSTENNDAVGPIPSGSEESASPKVTPLHLQNVILKEELMEELQPYLPLSKKGESFWMLYSMTRDGASLDLLLNKVQDAETTILAIETLDGEVFGAFCTQAWKKSHDYYGSGQSFLWRKNTHPAPGANLGEDDAQHQQHSRSLVQVFSFAYNNYNIQLVTSQNVIVGGSGGISEYATEYALMRSHDTSMMDSSSTSIHSTTSSHNNYNANRMSDDFGFGLWLGHDLLQGSSSPCSTFCSPSLSAVHADGSAFEIVNIEIWALTPCINLEQAKTAMDNKRFMAGHTNAMTKVSWMHSPSIRKSHQRRRSTNDLGKSGSVGTVGDGYYDEEDEDEDPVSLFGTSTNVPLAAAVVPSSISKEDVDNSPYE